MTVGIVFPAWTAPRCWLAYYYAVHGEQNRAIALADTVLAAPELSGSERALHHLSSAYTLSGRYDQARRLFERIEGRRHQIIQEVQYDRLGLRFFPSHSFHHIGHIGLLDQHVKGEILGIIPRCRNVILGASEEFSNPAYVRYWQKYFSFMTEPRTISSIAPLSYHLEQSLWVVWGSDGRMRMHQAFSREVQLRWENEGRSPLLELSAEHRERGYQLLRDLGVPEGAWFIALHVREANDPMDDARDCDITTYGLAIEEIAKRGGWVVRLGDRNMRPLPPHPNAIDYAHSTRRQDWMDVFLWAESRFLLGTHSGPQVIPPTFGKPVAISNFGPIRALFCGKDDILLPKSYWIDKEGRHLTIAEQMNPDYRLTYKTIKDHAAMGIRVIDNSAEEIRELVIEMMDRLEGRHISTNQECLMQARFVEIANRQELYPVKIARAFMSRYPDLL